MVRRQVSVWVDEEILRLFDEWAWGLRLSRTRAVEQVMGAAAKGGLSEGFGELGDPEVAADPARTVDQIESPDGTFTMSVLPAGGLASRTEAAETEAKARAANNASVDRQLERAGVEYEGPTADNKPNTWVVKSTPESPAVPGKTGPKVTAAEKPKVIAELAGRLEEVRAACTHPKDKVEKVGTWGGKRCGECGHVFTKDEL